MMRVLDSDLRLQYMDNLHHEVWKFTLYIDINEQEGLVRSSKVWRLPLKKYCLNSFSLTLASVSPRHCLLPIENGIRCSSLTIFPVLSKKRSGRNTFPSSQWSPWKSFNKIRYFYYTYFRVDITQTLSMLVRRGCIMEFAGMVSPLTVMSRLLTCCTPVGTMLAHLCTSISTACHHRTHY